LAANLRKYRRFAVSGTSLERDGDGWLPFLNTYRTMCVAPEPDFRHLLDEIRKIPIAA
jgi:hypothetical protein